MNHSNAQVVQWSRSFWNPWELEQLGLHSLGSQRSKEVQGWVTPSVLLLVRTSWQLMSHPNLIERRIRKLEKGEAHCAL